MALKLSTSARLIDSGDALQYSRLALEDVSFGATNGSKQLESIATGTTFTLKPQAVFGTSVYGLIIKSDRKITIAQTGVLVNLAGRFFALVSDGTTNGLANNDITISNTSGATATVEILLTGL